MVSVDRNTLISQIVSLNPQLKPDELRKLSDAQLQAKLSQCIAGNKQDKNVDSIKINNNNSSETPKMTTEEAQDNAIENIKSNAEQAQKLLEAQDNGDISKAYNFVKEKLNSELAKSNVAKVVHKQFETAEFLREAKQGTLTVKEYLRRKREDIFKTFPEIDNYNDKQKQMIKKGLDSLTEGQLNRLQNQLLALPKKDDKNYQNSVNSFKQNFIKESIDEKKISTTTKSENGQKITQKTTQKVKQAYNPSDGDRLMTFEETYLLEQGVKFNKENIQKFNDSAAQYTFANNLHNRLQDIHNMLDNDITLVKGNNANGVDLKTLENGNKRLKTSIYQALSKLYGNDINKINKGLQDLTGEKYTFKLKNNDPKQGLTLDNLELVDSSIPKDSKFKPNTDMVLPSLAEKVLKGLDTNYSKALNGKKLEDYAKTMANDYKNAYGTKDASALASSFAQDQEGIVQTARNTVQIAGMVVMVGGMAFFPPAALGGGLISSFGGIGVEAYNENTKENPDEEKNKELGQEVLVNAALFAIGAGSGKVGSMAKTALTAKNAPKLVAAMVASGVDSSLSLLGDLTLTGQIDLSGEGFSQLMSLVAGHKGKLVKGVQKGKQFLKEKLNAQANTNNKILQMPDGTVVEVKPDGSTIEVKADGEGTKAVKPEPKAENVKTETTLKTKKELESALDKATTREDFLAIRNEILKMPNSPERVKLFELYLKTYQDWSTKRVNGNDPNQYTDKPNMAVKNMAEGEIKTYTQEEVDKLIAQDPEHIKVMTNGKVIRITDNFEFVHIGNIAKSNGIKVLDSKAFDKKISNMRNEYNDTHRFTEDDRQKLNELYNNAKTDEEKQFLLQVIDAKLFTGDYQFNAKAISELQGNYSTEAKAIYEAMANIQSKQYSKIYYNQDFVDLMNLSKSVDKDIIIELINAKNVDNTPRFNGQNIQKWVELGQKTDKTEFLDMLHATDNNGAPKYNYSQIEEKIALKNPMAKSLLTKAQNLVKNNKKIKEIKNELIENIMNETPEAVNKQFKMINLLNDNALKVFLENYGLKNLNIDKQTVDAINSAHPKVLQVILKDGADDPNISLLLRDFEKIPTELLDSITDKNKFFNLVALVHSKSLGFIDIYNNTKPETLNRIPQNVKLELAQMGHVYTNETHISSALDFIKTPKYQELKTTLFEKFDSKFDAEDFDSKLQAYLIANKTGNPDDFINYVKSQDFNNLTSIAPRIKEFEPEQLFEFFNYHKSQGTKLTPENLTYKGNLTHTFETNMTDYQQLSQILSRYPNTDRRVGHLPKEWINDIPKSEQKDFVANIYQAFSNFASIPKDERNVNDLATTLKSIFKKDVKVEQLGYGSFGSGYEISIENSKPFVLKAFNNIDDDLKYMKNIHGRSIEPQNALYSKGKGNDFAGFYFGKVNDVIDKDGFMLNEFLPDKTSKSQQKDLTISRFDSSDVDRTHGHNFQYGKILDYGAMETTDKRLMENGNVTKLTRIISSNMIASKNSNVYGFNDTRLAIVKNAIDNIGNPKDTLDALSIVEKYATKEIDKNSLNELKALKKDAAFKLLEKNKPDIENKEAYFAAYELNDKITQIENSIINAFKDTGLDKGLSFSNRAKSVQSIYDKINSNMKKGKSLEASIQKVQDGYGVRTIMGDFKYKQYPEIVEMYKKDPEQAYRMAAKKQSEHIIKNLEKLIEKQLTNGDFSMVTISNYKGKNGLPYLSTEQINELCEFAKQKGITLDVKIDETGSMENIKGSGYTALQMNLKYKDGTVIEWQTRGKDVDKFAEAEHVMYDSRQEKDITGGREQLKELYAPYEKAAQDMETEDFADYMDYLTNYYKQLRLKELGFPVIFPKLPAKFGTNPDISADGLIKLHDEKERILKAT